MNEHLVVIDMQKQFLFNKPADSVASTVSVIGRLVQESRRLFRPVTYVTYSGYGPLIPELSSLSRPDELVVKCRDDAFSESDFLARVKGYGLLYIAGCNLEFCVARTIRSAIERNILVRAYRNAILSRDVDSELKRETELWLATAARCLYQDYND